MRGRDRYINLKNVDMRSDYEKALESKIFKIKSVMFWQMLGCILSLLCSISYMIIFREFNKLFIVGQIFCLLTSIVLLMRVQYNDVDVVEIICSLTTFLGLNFIATAGILHTTLIQIKYDDYISLIALSMVLCFICLFASPSGCECSWFSNTLNFIQNIIIFPIIYFVINGICYLSYEYLDGNVGFLCFAMLYMFSILVFANLVRLVKFIKINT